MPSAKPATPFDTASPTLTSVPDTEEWPTVESTDEVDEGKWPHSIIEFRGDDIEARKPTPQALAAFSLATSRYVSVQTRNDMTALFLARHLSQDSFDRVFGRLMDPDDTEYALDTIGELMRNIVELSVE